MKTKNTKPRSKKSQPKAIQPLTEREVSCLKTLILGELTMRDYVSTHEIYMSIFGIVPFNSKITQERVNTLLYELRRAEHIEGDEDCWSLPDSKDKEDSAPTPIEDPYEYVYIGGIKVPAMLMSVLGTLPEVIKDALIELGKGRDIEIESRAGGIERIRITSQLS